MKPEQDELPIGWAALRRLRLLHSYFYLLADESARLAFWLLVLPRHRLAGGNPAARSTVDLDAFAA